MLNAEESAAFDDALREDAALRHAYREINALGAAVAASQAIPLQARPGQLERLQARLGLQHRRPTNWLGISGWAIAASLALLLVISNRPGSAASGNVAVSPQMGAKTAHVAAANASGANGTAEDKESLAASNSSTGSAGAGEGKSNKKIESKRLIQEISVLREKLESVAKRDQKRFEIISGRSWPVMMTMAPPSSTADTATVLEDAPALTSRVGDALAGLSSIVGDPSQEPASGEPAAADANVSPTAIPIYDPFTDHGAIVVAGLPFSDPGMGNYLWVATETSDVPVLVGQLPPRDSQQPVSIDFTLGTRGILPTSFILTNGTIGNPAVPSEKNTILIGPR